MDKQMMFNNPFKLPTYSEWKESVEKIQADVMKIGSGKIGTKISRKI
jgi:hypothetical protein